MTGGGGGRGDGGVLGGRHVELVPITDVDPAGVEELLLVADEMPELGGALPPVGGGPPYGPPFVIRRVGDGALVGAVIVTELTGYPGVASVSIYMRPGSRAKGRASGEAYVRGVEHAFVNGARVVHHEVFAFNRGMLTTLRRLGAPEVARLRRHAYAAGRTWDVVVFAFDAATWARMRERFDHVVRALEGP